MSLRDSLAGECHVSGILTIRQIQCLRLVSAGRTSAQIGRQLGISADVVNEHVLKACRRLKARTRTQAVLIASLRELL